MKLKKSVYAFMIGSVMVMLVACHQHRPHSTVVGMEIGGPPPVCQWGYYDYAPYACAPYGYWGPDYFYNGIFIGVGPWFGWGYRHGWGDRRFHGYYRWNGREWGNRQWRDRDRGGGWRQDRSRGEWHERGKGWVRGGRGRRGR